MGTPIKRDGAVWQYRSELLPRSADLVPYGNDGWECYAVVPAGGDMAMFYFKRRH